ncbi:MAG TPA: S41 family peptidase [Novosphingobium sp.]|nr:S41 family peptidase [Novosphingobium sp.]
MNCNSFIAAILAIPLALVAVPAAAEPGADDFRADAQSFEALVNQRYAYLERFQDATFRLTPRLQAEAEAVHDSRGLLLFLEHAVALLGDHHAITGASFRDSWALVPSYADLWAVRDEAGFRITDIKPGSPADGIVSPGDRLLAIAGVPAAQAVSDFWQDIGVDAPTPDQQAYAARILLAGRRDRERRFTLAHAKAAPREIELPNLYAFRREAGDRPAISLASHGNTVRIRFNDSLGDTGTIAVFDNAMASLKPSDRVVIDLADTGSGGNTTVGRAIMGWFVDLPRPYQMHSSPEEFRETGIARQWAEYVLPRAGKHHPGPVVVHVGRWTGSMGEGLAVGFDALGFAVCGTSMAGLLGAIEDNRLERTGEVVKFPTERLSTMGGIPRENFRPRSLDDRACAADRATL